MRHWIGSAITGAAIALGLASAGSVVAAPSNAECEARVNDTPRKLLPCIQEAALYGHLVDFQAIADRNPGPDGHGNRDTGGAGYKASVDYVAGLMRKAGYRVTIQPYAITGFDVDATPVFHAAGRDLALGQDWYVARLSGSGAMTAPVRPVGGLRSDGGPTSGAGCSAADFAGFGRGAIALIERGGCELDAKVARAQAAGAVGVIIYNSNGPADREDAKEEAPERVAWPATLAVAAHIPVIVAAYDVGAALVGRYAAGDRPAVSLDIRTHTQDSIVDYNVIADSPFGDRDRVVVVDAHLDSIYGAGILDNASGSSTILEVALKLARTPTVNQLRYIWFGGEEIGLLGSKYYTSHLTPADLSHIAFDIDCDVTATPNYVVLVADPRFSKAVMHFPSDVVPRSRIGNLDLERWFAVKGIAVLPAKFGNDGTDSKSFAFVGVPDTGILTQQDCCKGGHEQRLWGGFLGNYEGRIPSFDGGCVDYPNRWCDDITNISPYVMEFVSKGFAYATLRLANDRGLAGRRR